MMNYLVMAFAAATTIAGIVMVFNPDTLFNPIRKRYTAPGMHVLAVLLRIILGIALVSCAPASRYPILIQIIGWITLLAALVLGVMGRANFKHLVAWALGMPGSFLRVGGLVAAFFGAFLIYAVF
jgi:hypothetical protein